MARSPRPASEHGLAPLPARRPTSASSATRSAAASAGSRRKHGLAANSVTAIELVTADGALVRADRRRRRRPVLGAARRRRQLRRRHRDRVRALRRSPTVYAGMLLWPVRARRRGARGVGRVDPTVPDEVTTSARMLQVPPLPEHPGARCAAARSSSIDGAFLGDEAAAARAARAAARARAGDGHVRARSRRAPWPASTWTPRTRSPASATARCSASSTAEAIDALVAVAGPARARRCCASSCATSAARVAARAGGRRRGRAAARRVPAVRRRDGRVAGDGRGGRRRASTGWARRWRRGPTARHYLNFTEKRVDPATFYAPADYARLQEIRATVDPRGLFVANHAI